jgi:hypothetical protein
VFGPGAATELTPTPTAAGPAPATGTTSTPAQLQGAISAIDAALDRLRAAQQSGDFAGQGNALADLDKAVKQFHTATNAAPNTH